MFISVELILVLKHIVYPHICVDGFEVFLNLSKLCLEERKLLWKKKIYIYVSFLCVDLFFVYQYCSFEFLPTMYSLSKEDFNSLVPSFPS